MGGDGHSARRVPRLVDAFDGRRVFVTGHTGFKGSWLALWLGMLGAEVTGFALEPPTTPSLYQTLGLAEELCDVRGDVRDGASLTRALQDHRPEVVFHLAAQALVRPSYDDPVGTYATNVMGTVHLLEAVRRCPSVRAVIVVTSDKCYENPDGAGAHQEGDAMGGRDPYSSSKGCAELVTTAYRDSYLGTADVGVVSVRAGNVIGGGDWGRDRLLADSARALAAGETIVVRNPAAVRPWQFVLEPLAGYLWVAAATLSDTVAGAGPWNFGPASLDAVSVAQVVESFIGAWGSGSWQTATPGARAAVEANSLLLDSAKAAEELGWRTLYSVDQAVAVSAAWYRAFYQGGQDMRALSRGVIAAYEEHAARAGQRWAAPLAAEVGDG